MKLYYLPGACSLATHIVLRELGLNFDLIKVIGKTKELEGGGNLLDVSPKGQVPTLVTDDGAVLTEGVAIMQYAADTNNGSAICPPCGTIERLRVQEAMNFISSEYHKSFGPFFNPTSGDEVKNFFRPILLSRLDQIEKQLSDGRAFYLGANFTIADAYLFTVTNWTKFIGLDLANYPNLGAYVGRIASRPAVQESLKAEGLLK